MRLIDVDRYCAENILTLVEYQANPPKYAILSHTWEHDEVSYEDVGEAREGLFSKHGFSKIKYACHKARQHKILYLWVDTCCIKSSSSTELSEAINSMYRWYAEAEICYTYLSDMPGDCPQLKESISGVCHAFEGVHSIGTTNRPGLKQYARQTTSSSASFTSKQAVDSCPTHDTSHWIALLEMCRWWTRGWTLQELIAPSKVAFFGKDWNPIGWKHDLLYTISRISGIDTLALTQECDLTELSVAKKLSWAAGRKTTRKEDEAYCLLGILDINMTLLYGEGEKAFLRLQEEVIKRTTDPSLFLWPRDSGEGLFAPSPTHYRGCSRIAYDPTSSMQLAWSMTHRGLKMSLPVIEDRSDSDSHEYLGILPCHLVDDFSHKLAIHVRRETSAHLSDEAYSIQTCRPICTHGRSLQISGQIHAINIQDLGIISSERKDILVPRENFRYVENFSALKHTSSVWVRSVPEEFKCLQAYPQHQWNMSALTWNRHASLARRVCSRAAGILLKSGDAEIAICVELYHNVGVVLIHLLDEDEELSYVCEQISNRCHRISQSTDRKAFRTIKDDATSTSILTASMDLVSIMGETVWVIDLACEKPEIRPVVPIKISAYE